MHLIKFVAGEPYDPDDPGPLPETPHLLITGTSVLLAVSYQNVNPVEVHAFNYGQVQFAWVDSEQVALLAFKLGDLPWADCPFHPRLIAERGWERPRLEKGVGHAMLMTLVEATTGIIVTNRWLGLPANFVTAMAVSTERMMAAPYDMTAHDAALDALYERYPTSEELVRRRADVTCIGAKPDSALPGMGEDAN